MYATFYALRYDNELFSFSVSGWFLAHGTIYELYFNTYSIVTNIHNGSYYIHAKVGLHVGPVLTCCDEVTESLANYRPK